MLAIARETLLPIVVTERDLRGLPERLVEQAAAMLESSGVPADAVASERDAMRDVVYARTDDRSNVGVLTEFQRLLAFDLSDSPELTMLDLSLRLAWTPIVARNTFPVDVICNCSASNHRVVTGGTNKARPSTIDVLPSRNLTRCTGP